MGKLRRTGFQIALVVVCLIGLVAIPGGQAVQARSAGKVLVADDRPPIASTAASTARFDRISMADGLPDDVVYAILQDRQGFMWFGTENGLARYDGYQFTVYQYDPGDPTSLSYPTVYEILQTRNGDLWLGTGGGLDRFDPKTKRFTHYPMSPVISLCEDELGILWVGTEFGLTHLDPANPAPSVFYRAGNTDNPLRPSGNTVYAIVQDQEGEIWLGMGAGASYSSIQRGLDRFDRPSGTFVHYRHDPGNPTSLSAGDVWAISLDRQGGLWVGTEGGLNRLDISSQGFTRYQHNPDDPLSLADDHVTSVLEDSAGRLWIGTANGLDQLDPSQNRFIHYRHDQADAGSLSGDEILALYEDRSGVVWVGTTTGISRYDETASRFALYQNRPDSPYRLSDDLVLAVIEDRKGDLWVGTETGGLNRLDRDVGTATVYRHDPADPASLSGDAVTALYEDRAGILWVGTGNQWLERFDPETETFVHYWYVSAGVPRVIAEDRMGDLWIGTENGLYRLDRAKTATHYRTTAEPALSVNFVTAIHQLQDGRLLVGTFGGGIDTWDPATEQFAHYRHDPANPDSLAIDVVYSFYEDPGGEAVWIGTWRGLDRMERTSGRVSHHYGEQEGLSGNAVMGILADSTGMLWLTTNRGLSRFDPHTKTFRNYSAQDGLPDGRLVRTAYSQSSSGEFLLGSTEGLVAFYPDRMPENPFPPPIAITTLSLFNEVIRRDLSPGEPIDLSYKQNFLSFEFAALDYTAPEKNQYAYRLEGVDPGWVQAGARRRADYPNLRPGKYIFRVKASNNAGLWNEGGAAVQITISPPPWGTWWFRGIVLLALAAAAAGAYRLRVRGIEARSRKLERQVADRTAELSQANLLLEQEVAEHERTEGALAQERASTAVIAERNRLARELHDSATQSLYAVTLYADAATRLLSSGQVEPAAENLAKLRGTAKEALGEMRMLIFELRPPILAEQGLAAALAARLEAVEGRAGLQTEFHVERERRLPPEIEEGLYRIAVEALNNALRHARARCISVSLRFEPEATSLEVADDGIGFDPAAIRRSSSQGLQGMAERAEELGGALIVDSTPGTGARVRAVVPRKSEQEEVPK